MFTTVVRRSVPRVCTGLRGFKGFEEPEKRARDQQADPSLLGRATGKWDSCLSLCILVLPEFSDGNVLLSPVISRGK